MTGFGSSVLNDESYELKVEIKSVNHRFKDIRFKMGNVFNPIEIELKNKLTQIFKRGSFDIYINYKKGSAVSTNDLDQDKILNFLSTIQSVSEKTSIPIQISPTEFLRGDFTKDDSSYEQQLQQLALKCFDEACEKLQHSREKEGSKLAEVLKKHQSDYSSHFEQVKSLKDTYQSTVKERLNKKLEEEKESVDQARFNQELIYYLEKLDISEEINRIDIHLQKLSQILDSKLEIGRQIDFLVQELNRETNTIGSKSGSSDISAHVIQMKIHLEKIREQALNIE